MVVCASGFTSTRDYLTTAPFKPTVFCSGHPLHTNLSSFYLPLKDGSLSRACLPQGIESHEKTCIAEAINA